MSAWDSQAFTNEQLLVETIKDWVGGSAIGDDCAVLPGGMLVTTDTLVEGTHFVAGWTSYRDLGWKSCAVNLSDVAAMSGRARYLVIALTIPEKMKRSELREFYDGFLDCARTYRAQVVGGDLTSGPILVIGVTAIGYVHENGVLNRSGARAGDIVVVTGDFGASAAGLWLLRNGCDTPTRKRYSYCLERHVRPLPRLCESWALVRKTGSRGALIDGSDGLADALVQIARKSAVGMEIDFGAVPVEAQTRAVAAEAGVELADWVLYGGEDYELVGTLGAELWKNWQGAADNPFTAIGTVTNGDRVILSGGKGTMSELDLSKCFQHVRKSAVSDTNLDSDGKGDEKA